MANHALLELQTLNAAIDSRDPHYFVKHGYSRDWFPTYTKAFDFITDHIRQHNEMPTLTTVTGAVPDFDFAESESPDVLKRKLGDALAKRELAAWLKTADTSVPFADLQTAIEAKSQELATKYGARRATASNWRTSGADRFARYTERESNKRALIPSGFRELNLALTGKPDGAFVKGDYIPLYGVTKRGKSNIVRKVITLPAVRAGFRVLDICLENERYEIEAMLDSMEAADREYLPVTVDGMTLAGGFDRKKLAFGYLDRTQRDAYKRWTEELAKTTEGYGDYIIKTFEDPDMDIVDIRKIEALIDEYEPDVVLVDPLYLTTYPRTNDKTPGAGAQAMSRALRRLATRKQVVMAVVVQAQIEKGENAALDDEAAELEVPDMTRVKSTKAVLEDGTVTLGITSAGHKALIGVMLSRKGGAGAEVVAQFIPQYGIVRPWDEAIERQLEAAGSIKLF